MFFFWLKEQKKRTMLHKDDFTRSSSVAGAFGPNLEKKKRGSRISTRFGFQDLNDVYSSCHEPGRK